MGNLTPPSWLERPAGRLAYRHRPGKGPTIIFLPGYASDMAGMKALLLDEWATRCGRAMLRLDYSGCGESEGCFEDGTLAAWRDDVLAVIDAVARGPLLLVGSSMGGWLMLLVAQALGARVKGLVGIAAAPDFTDWGFDEAEKAVLRETGRLERASDYGPEPMLTTRGFWLSGQANLLLGGPIAIDCPVRLLHGQRDIDVPWGIAMRLAERLRSDDVQVTLIKDGDHRLSRPQDLALLVNTVERMLET